MRIISLITDFGLKDSFVGVMKAVILKINPSARIIDISHEVKPQDTMEAAFLLKSSFKFFPPKTVHLVVVDPGVGTRRKKILVKTKNYFFIGPDNGVLSLALKDELPQEVIEIINKRYFLSPISDTFHGRDIFAPTAAYLAKGEDIKKFGRVINSLKILKLPEVKVTTQTLTGKIIYIDRFGNLVSNIDKDTLINFISATKHGGKNKKFKICIKNKSIDRLSHSYSEGLHLKPIALIDSFDYLEIAIKNASAHEHLGLNKGSKIQVIRLC